MLHEGYADSFTNDGPRFHSDIPVIEFTERVTRAIEASDVSSAPPDAETVDGVTHETKLMPRPCLALGSTLCRARPLATPDVWVGARRLGPCSQKLWLRTLASQKNPPDDSTRITRGLRGYTHRVRSRAPAGKSKHPPGDST